MVEGRGAVYGFDGPQFGGPLLHSQVGSLAWRNSAALAFLVAAIWPLLTFSHPAMQDYPNHVARAFILLHQHDPALEQAYNIHWTAIPDLGWDIWAVTLGRLMPLHVTAVAFLVFYFITAIAGLLALNRAFGNPSSVIPLLAVPFLMNGGYAKGFFNFDLGMAVMLWALAAWIWLDEERWLRRLLVGVIFSTSLYIIHFYAFAVYGLFILGLELPRCWHKGWRSLPGLAGNSLQALPALLMLLLAGRNVDLPRTIYERPWHRIIDLTLLIDTNHTWLNIVLISLLIGALGFSVAGGGLKVPKQLFFPLLLCLVVYVAIPDSIFGTAYVAWRTLLAAVLVGVASLEPVGGQRRVVTFLAILAFGITLLNSALFATNASRGMAERGDFLAVISPMRVGARLFWAHSGGTQHALLSHEAGTYHLGSEAVEARDALVQSMFATAGQQVLEFRDPRFRVPDNSQTFLNEIIARFRERHADFAAYVRSFNYVLLEGPGDARSEAALPVAQLRLIYRIGDFRLYAVTLPHIYR